MIVDKMLISIRSLTTNLVVFALVFSSSLTVFAQDRGERQARESRQRGDSSGRSPNNDEQEAGFVTYADGDQTTCRDMTQSETLELRRDPEQLRQLRVITPIERQEALRDTPMAAQTEGVNGLTITLRSTAQLDGFPEAKAAFIRAAAQWEAQIKNPISIIIDVDYGPTRFGTAYPTGVLGSTSTPTLTQTFNTVRARLVNSAGGASETTLYNALPTGTINTDVGALGQVSVASPLSRALGLSAADAGTSETAPSIGFNSNFAFDFDPSNGISSGQTDFDAVAVHEMGHALGFISRVGGSTTTLSVWDIFRFRPGTTLTTFTAAQRILTTGGEHRFFDGNPELACSTGGPSGTGGDGRQASHWKADEQSGVYIGIMDPTLSSGQRKTMTSNDLQMLETIGYTINGTVTPPPPTCTYVLSPTNASFGTTGGQGSVSVDASADTCTRTATSNASWLTVTSGASGTGDGAVGYLVAPNTGGSRSGTLTIGGQPFTVSQSGCSFTVSFSTTTFPSTASTGTITVTATGTNCPWTASDNRNWITLTPTNGTGSRTVTFSLTANNSTSSRTGRITVAGTQITITQRGR
jgi:Putative binding domain, N-terminal